MEKACNRSLLVFILGYRQVTIFHNKHRTVHAFGSVNLRSACSRGMNIGGIQDEENKS